MQQIDARLTARLAQQREKAEVAAGKFRSAFREYKTLNDPATMQDALKELMDPATQERVKAMMDDPEFQKSVRHANEQLTPGAAGVPPPAAPRF